MQTRAIARIQSKKRHRFTDPEQRRPKRQHVETILSDKDLENESDETQDESTVSLDYEVLAVSEEEESPEIAPSSAPSIAPSSAPLAVPMHDIQWVQYDLEFYIDNHKHFLDVNAYTADRTVDQLVDSILTKLGGGVLLMKNTYTDSISARIDVGDMTFERVEAVLTAMGGESSDYQLDNGFDRKRINEDEDEEDEEEDDDFVARDDVSCRPAFLILQEIICECLAELSSGDPYNPANIMARLEYPSIRATLTCLCSMGQTIRHDLETLAANGDLLVTRESNTLELATCDGCNRNSNLSHFWIFTSQRSKDSKVIRMGSVCGDKFSRVVAFLNDVHQFVTIFRTSIDITKQYRLLEMHIRNMATTVEKNLTNDS